MFTEKEQRWVPHRDALPQDEGEGIVRRVLAYTGQLMCVENHFKEGAVGEELGQRCGLPQKLIQKITCVDQDVLSKTLVYSLAIATPHKF